MVNEANFKNDIHERIRTYCRTGKKISVCMTKQTRIVNMKKAWTSTGEKLEIEGKAAEVIWQINKTPFKENEIAGCERIWSRVRPHTKSRKS